jgi:hypothetical protein
MYSTLVTVLKHFDVDLLRFLLAVATNGRWAE